MVDENSGAEGSGGGTPRPLPQYDDERSHVYSGIRQWVVASGKGGTGKTSLVASFARLAGRVVLADADVDAANLALGLETEDETHRDFYSGTRAFISPQLCTLCGECLEACRYGAIRAGDSYVVDELACEGCNACAITCSAEAIILVPNLAGELRESKTPYGPLVYAELGVAQDNSGKLVTEVIEIARKRAAEEGIGLVMVDGPPGIGCPVHAALTGAERLLAVTEPSVSGLHDLERLLELAAHFRIPAAVCINRWDVAPEEAEKIEAGCRARSIPVIGRVPFDRGIPSGLCRGTHPLDSAAPPSVRAIQDVWEAWVALGS
jgi:MinD superfamily P-loop ATPase